MKTYKRYRYPSQIISHTVWLYHRFTLSFRDIEDILAALRELGVKGKHDTRQYANNIAEISHQKTLQQQRQMRNYKSIKHAQKFLPNHGLINNLFRHQRHLAKAKTYRLLREESFNTWTQTSCVQNLVIA